MTRMGTGQRLAQALRNQRTALPAGPLAGELGTIEHALSAIGQHAGTRYLRGHLEAIGAARAQLRQIHSQLDADIAAARRTVREDLNLSPQGKQAREQQLITDAQQRAEQASADVRARVTEAARAVHDAARLPDPEAGVEALLTRQAIWQRQRQLLDAGIMRIPQLLAETEDVETLLALRAELPVYVRAGGATRETADRITNMVEGRLASVAGGETYARYAALAAADTTATAIGAAHSQGGLTLAGALAGRLTEEQALAGYQSVGDSEPGELTEGQPGSIPDASAGDAPSSAPTSQGATS
jgi:hypothetical protein